MHIKTGSWEANNAVCESDRLCDPAVLVSPPKPEPHIRNRRLSPGSGIGGGGGGGCAAGPDKQLRQASPSTSEAVLNGTGQPFAFPYSRERERRGHIRGGRGPRRESPRVGGRVASGDKPQRPGPVQKARWVEDSLSLLKPPPAFPVKDSPAKLQPAVSYASKVKAGGGAAGGTEEPPGIGVLLQNQWGLSFISDGPAENSLSAAAAPDLPQTPQAAPEPHPTVPSHPLTGDMDSDKPAPANPPAPATPSFSLELCSRQDESSGELLLTCRHLVEAMQYHMQEWNTVYNRQKEDPAKVVWYKNSLEQPA
ncbi:hypothetical protein ACEWY4_001916 [Coilia grayii]|uniref:Uncharacterized protein n=1 Tax=Coilia grayii TaxID=363190 RepID=A0ABD1KUA7_9TELE